MKSDTMKCNSAENLEEEQETDKSVAVIYRIRRVLRPFNEWLNICESLLENEENGFLNDILKIRYAPVNGERLDYYVDLLFRLCDSMENGSFIGMLVDVVGSIESSAKSNLFQKASESRWILEYHFFLEVCKGCEYDKFRVHYIIVIDKVKENPVDSMEQIIDEMANIHRTENFYERMEASVKRLYCESRFGKKAFYHKVEVCSVQEFKLDFLVCLPTKRRKTNEVQVVGGPNSTVNN